MNYDLSRKIPSVKSVIKIARHALHAKRLRYISSNNGYSLVQADKLRCIFVHIPKCAGLSISMALFGNKGGGHLTAAEYKNIYSADEYKNFFKFTFVRNPWDRLASAFFYLKSGGTTREDSLFSKKHLVKAKTFEHFVHEYLQLPHINNYKHFIPQVHFICNTQNSSQLDYVGRFENLQNDFDYICGRLAIPKKIIPVNNQVSHPNYKTLYTNTMVDTVAEFYSKDIAFLNYDFE